ncbi:4-hydroxy-tetrahydrodipicolinate synthase [Ruminococcus sp. YE71]|uniref:4-hydroxy-tetrahydrodipicolinate synthase n=1 Tax=unclassified Ruminococcus TaxID=2608920 RepID=UPI000886FA4A|nr:MULTISPECIES: 4-hydroxy-tetrahydrodipicolinate synthase [unclassified Ruminococcus]SDA24138.1 4-hydroxy-tetrahydrodipicolinate synthase [Ruminococcus sp. YE78]SFW41361.1 4-hydroxy-tetrahydrodipicolinate synthase [Ruminococcus sp. YE71]
MKKTIFTGAGVAIATPMNADGSINYDELGRLIDFQIENGTDAIIICGTTGESACMTDEEHIECIKFAVERTAKRVPVIAGTGSNHTEYAVNLSKHAEQLGADALLCVTPYYNKASQQGLIKHFSAIAEAVTLPIILYNVPSRTGCNILPETAAELAKIDNIVAIKEASGNISQIAKVRQLCGDTLDIYSGNDDQIVPIMSLGGKGVISVLSNVVPKQTHEIAALCLENKWSEALDLAMKYLPLANVLFCDVNPIPVKEALNVMGFKAGSCRLPLCDTSDDKKAKIKAELDKLGLTGSIK